MRGRTKREINTTIRKSRIMKKEEDQKDDNIEPEKEKRSRRGLRNLTWGCMHENANEEKR